MQPNNSEINETKRFSSKWLECFYVVFSEEGKEESSSSLLVHPHSTKSVPRSFARKRKIIAVSESTYSTRVEEITSQLIMRRRTDVRGDSFVRKIASQLLSGVERRLCFSSREWNVPTTLRESTGTTFAITSPAEFMIFRDFAHTS